MIIVKIKMKGVFMAAAQPILPEKNGVCSASFNIADLEKRRCMTEILVNLHNRINDYEKLLKIAENQWAKQVFQENSEFKENINYAIIENKAKLSILREVTQLITDKMQKGEQ